MPPTTLSGRHNILQGRQRKVKSLIQGHGAGERQLGFEPGPSDSREHAFKRCSASFALTIYNRPGAVMGSTHARTHCIFPITARYVFSSSSINENTEARSESRFGNPDLEQHSLRSLHSAFLLPQDSGVSFLDSSNHSQVERYKVQPPKNIWQIKTMPPI